MVFATSQSALPVPNTPKLPAIAPFLDIGTIFYFDDMPQLANLACPLAGLITHMGFGLLLVPFS